MFKRIICYTEMTNLLQFKMNVRKSHSQPQFTLQPVCEDRVLFVWADLHFSLYEQLHSKWERAIPLVYPTLFCKLRSSSGCTNKILTVLVWKPKQSYHGNRSHMFIWTHCFSQRTKRSPPKIFIHRESSCIMRLVRQWSQLHTLFPWFPGLQG